jgi:hypothetical protein
MPQKLITFTALKWKRLSIVTHKGKKTTIWIYFFKLKEAEQILSG